MISFSHALADETKAFKFGLAQSWFDDADDTGGDFVLQFEDVVEDAIETVRPLGPRSGGSRSAGLIRVNEYSAGLSSSQRMNADYGDPVLPANDAEGLAKSNAGAVGLLPALPRVRRFPEGRAPKLLEPSNIGGRPRRDHGLTRWATVIALLCIAGAAIYSFMLPPSLSVISPRRGPAIQAVYATGTVEPSVMVPIAARIAARLVELSADEGSAVSQGQILARLEDDDLRRGIEAAEAEERYAKAAFERAALLVERGAAARSLYDRAKADWEKAQATAAQATAQARFLQLVAPAAGSVIRRDGEIGQMIGANQTVFWLSCCAPLRISAEVDEEDIAEVRPGQAVLIRSDAFPGRTFKGEVQSITPKGDPVARSYRVRISLPADTPLMIGMSAETNIVLRQVDSALLVPATAVQEGAVWLVDDGRIIRRKVVVGAKGATEVEIIEGLAENERIVVAPTPGLKPNQKIRPSAAAERR